MLFAAEKATQMALDAIQLLGGNGYINDYPTGRLLRDAKLYEIGAGTSEIRRWLIGREIMAEACSDVPLRTLQPNALGRSSVGLATIWLRIAPQDLALTIADVIERTGQARASSISQAQ